MEPIIKVENISKRYRLGSSVQVGTATLRDEIALRLRSGFSTHSAKPDGRTIWALQDVSFEVEAGETVGFVGNNGAGKSTLLKILSRITKPTRGGAELQGRVGSLLEVGTGFHNELTGRENVFLNGAILGMRRSEIARKFVEIVDFAEMSKFIDTPVKHYSSGMYMRLAFAIAAHLETEILIVDEVLAVGDISFQRKCFRKMREANEEGRTVLFVSHNMQAISRLCKRCLLLREGRLVEDGPVAKVLGLYLNSSTNRMAEREWLDLDKAPGNTIAKLLRVRVRDEAGQTVEACDIRKPVGIEMTYEVLEQGHVLIPNYHCFNEEGVCVFILHDLDPEWRHKPRPVGHYVSTAWIPGNFLSEGTLIIGAAVSTHDPLMIHFYERDAIAFQVIDSLDGDSARGDFAGTMPGVVRPLLFWSTQFLPGRH